MALHSSRRTQDQNLNIHFDGVKTNSVKPAQQAQQGIKKRSKGKQTETVVAEDESKKNSGKPSALQPMIYRRRALNDISNFGKPNKRTQGKNSQIRVSGRKALTDLTNSVKPKKRTQGKQTVTVVAEDENFPCYIAEEGFLHNHDECIQSQKKSMDLDQFLEINGWLDEENPNLSPTSPIFFSEMEEEIPELIIQRRRPRLGQTCPIFGCPNSPWQPYNMKDDYDIFPCLMDYNLPNFVLKESPRSSK